MQRLLARLRYNVSHSSCSVDDLRDLASILLSVTFAAENTPDGVEVPNDARRLIDSCQPIYQKIKEMLSQIDCLS